MINIAKAASAVSAQLADRIVQSFLMSCFMAHALARAI